MHHSLDAKLIALLLLSTSSAWAQAPEPIPGTDAAERDSGFSTMSALNPVPLGPRSSPFEPPTQNDTTFLVDASAGELDTGCSFRTDGPLEFEILIDRYVGPVDANGQLQNADALIAAGVIGPTARLVMPAYDIDPGGVYYGVVVPPEIDQVSLNGQVLGNLTGANNIWRLNEFTVDIRHLRFPARGSGGSAPTGVRNIIRIDIDQASGSVENWCTAIDWASLGIQAVSPILLVHGNGSDAGFWDRHDFSTAMAAAHLPFDGCANSSRCLNPINLPTTLVANNGGTLATVIPPIVRSFGADSFHIVAHSKGGLDSRGFLARLPSDSGIELISHTTLSTPHNGSVLADIGQARVTAGRVNGYRYRGFPMWTQTLSGMMENNDGNPNLTTGFTATFNAQNISSLPPAIYNQVAADADRNGSQSINSEAEIAALRLDSADLPSSTFIATRVVNTLYQNLRRVSGVELTIEVRRRRRFAVLTAVPTDALLQNDILVTVPSGLGQGSISTLSNNTRIFAGVQGRNHSDVADGNVASTTVIPWILEAARSRGDLR